MYAKLGFDAGQLFVINEETILAPENPTSINPSNGFVGCLVDGVPVNIITPVSTGKYVIPLQDSYVRLLNVSMVVQNTVGITSVAGVQWMGPESQIQSNTSPEITLQFVDFAGAAVAPANYDVILLAVSFANSTAL